MGMEEDLPKLLLQPPENNIFPSVFLSTARKSSKFSSCHISFFVCGSFVGTCLCPNPQLPHITCALRNVSILSCRSVSLTLASKHFMRLLFFKAFLKCPFFCKSSHFFNQSSLWFVIFVSSVLEIELGTLCVFSQALCHIHIPLGHFFLLPFDINMFIIYVLWCGEYAHVRAGSQREHVGVDSLLSVY